MERKITVNVIHFQRGKIKPEFYLCSKKSAENIEMIMSNTNENKMERMIVDWSGLNQAAKISREKNTKNICITRSIKVFYSFKGVSGRQR